MLNYYHKELKDHKEVIVNLFVFSVFSVVQNLCIYFIITWSAKKDIVNLFAFSVFFEFNDSMAKR